MIYHQFVTNRTLLNKVCFKWFPTHISNMVYTLELYPL